MIRQRSLRIAAWLVGTRALVTTAMVAGTWFPKRDPTFWFGRAGDFFFKQVPIRWLDVWGRWDSDFYVAIARSGYPGFAPDRGWVWNAAYFPFLPAMMRGLSVLLGGVDVYVCGVVVANAMLVLAVSYADRLVRLDGSDAFAELFVVCLLAYPGSHWFSCVYTESSALFFGVFAIYCARTGLAPAAGLACALSAFTRSSGVMVCLPVLYEFCRTPSGALRWSWRALWLALPAVTLGEHMLVNYDIYRDPIYFAHVQAGWGRTFVFFPWSLVWGALHAPPWGNGRTLDYPLWGIAALTLVYLGWRMRERLGYMLLATADTLLPLSTKLLNGIHRYMGSNFPLFLILARLIERRTFWRRLYLGAGLGLLALFSFKWGQGFTPN